MQLNFVGISLFRFFIFVYVDFRFRVSVLMNFFRVIGPQFRTFPRIFRPGIKNLFSSLKTQWFNFHNRIESNSRKIVYMDLFPVAEWLAVNTTIAGYIHEKTSSEVRIFNFMIPSSDSRNLTRSYGLDHIEIIRLLPRQYVNLMRIYLRVLKDVRTPKNLFELELSGVRIGLDIYESVLRTGVPTVQVDSVETRRKIYLALRQYIFFLEKLSSNQIHSFLLSHDSYIGPGICSRMAHHFQVPVIQANIFEINILQRPFQNYERFRRYREYFASLDPEAQASAILFAKDNIKRRLHGEVNIERDGREISSLDASRKVPRQIRESQRSKILVLTHDFFDNPHAYSILPFLDFMEWLELLATIANKSDYDWYIKCHPDTSGVEQQIINEFAKRHPVFTIVDALASFQQLAIEGINFATTCYGTVGSELPLLGISVINASYNPHIAYSFNTHAQDLQQYKYLLENLSELHHPVPSFAEIYEFAYVHRVMMWPDGFSLPSVGAYLNLSNYDCQSVEARNYIWENRDLISRNIRNEFKKALEDSRVYSVEKCLPLKSQIKLSKKGNYLSFFQSLSL